MDHAPDQATDGDEACKVSWNGISRRFVCGGMGVLIVHGPSE